MEYLAVASGLTRAVAPVAAAADTAGLQINLFWVIVSAANFLVFAAILWVFALKPLTGMLDARRERIEEGLRDAEAARQARAAAESERAELILDARREANDIIGRAQAAASELREADIAATRAELERLRGRAASEIEAEKQRAIADLRAEVADLALAAAGRVVGESMTDERQRRLVQEFLAESASPESKD